MNRNLLVYPNPVDEQAIVTIAGLPSGSYSCRVLNLSSQIIMESTIEMTSGFSSVSTAGLPKGVYVLTVMNDTQQYSQIIIVK